MARYRLMTILAGAAAAALLLLAGPPPARADREPVTIQLWGLPEQDAFEGWIKVLEEYDAKHPEIAILRGSPGGQEGAGADPQKLMTAAVSGKPPDLIWMDRFQLASWAARGIFLPLDDYFERDGIDRSDFFKACLDECIYDGKTYGLPWDTDSRALHVNMKLLREGGYSEPPRDWDELKEMMRTLTRRTPQGKYQQVGFAPMFGNAWLYIYGWANGGEFMSKDGRRVTLTDPKIVEALAWMKSCYDQVGGAQALEDFRAASQGEGAADPFRAGKIAMQIIENSALDYIAKYTPDMELRVVPAPSPKGMPPVSWSGGFCWSIPKDAAAREEAWRLARYLSTLEAWERYGEFQMIANERRARAEGLTTASYVPRISCSRTIAQAQIRQVKAHAPKVVADAYAAHVELLEVCRFRPVTAVGKLLWDEQSRATNNVLFANMDPKAALAYGERVVQEALDKLLTPSTAPVFSLGKVFAGAFSFVLIAGLAGWGVAASRWRWTPRTRAEAGAGLLFVAPWLIGFVVLMLGPMIASLIISFSEYNVLTPARWVGTQNFTRLMGFIRNSEGELVASDPLFWKSLQNTALATAIGVPLGLVAGLGLALLVNREVRGVRIYRTLLYIPVVVPVVAGSVLWLWVLNSETGLNGAVLSPILSWLGLKPISFFANPALSRLGVILLVTWGAGASMIIWLAGLKSIPRTYYEAAAIDGAGPVRQFFTVTLPLLSPYLFFNMVMGIIGWLQIFVQPYVFIVPPGYGPGDSMLYYMIYLFAQGFSYFNMGIACAMAWILFVIVALLTLFQFKLAPKWVHYDA